MRLRQKDAYHSKRVSFAAPDTLTEKIVGHAYPRRE
jgi:hypothetical protein